MKENVVIAFTGTLWNHYGVLWHKPRINTGNFKWLKWLQPAGLKKGFIRPEEDYKQNSLLINLFIFFLFIFISVFIAYIVQSAHFLPRFQSEDSHLVKMTIWKLSKKN